MGEGDYRLTYHFEPPSSAGFIRHVDKATGGRIGGSRSRRVGIFTSRASQRSSASLAQQRLKSALSALFVAAALVAAYNNARAEELFSATVTIRAHRFEPAELHVPAGKRILLTIVNADALSEEFDSKALKVEKGDRRRLAGRRAHRPA
jgi:hypothetical protein